MEHHKRLHDIKLPATGRDDPEAIREVCAEYHDRGESVPAAAVDDADEFDPAHYDAEGEHGYFLHRARKDALGVSWPEYVNMAVTDAGGMPDTATLADAVAARIDKADGMDIDEIAAMVVDDLSGDVRQASFQGAKEALQEASTGGAY